MPTFQSTISLGTVLHLIGLLITILTIFWKVSNWIATIQLSVMTEIHSLHATNLAALSKIDTRLSVVESRVTDLWEHDHDA